MSQINFHERFNVLWKHLWALSWVKETGEFSLVKGTCMGVFFASKEEGMGVGSSVFIFILWKCVLCDSESVNFPTWKRHDATCSCGEEMHGPGVWEQSCLKKTKKH